MQRTPCSSPSSRDQVEADRSRRRAVRRARVGRDDSTSPCTGQGGGGGRRKLEVGGGYKKHIYTCSGKQVAST